jgi:hypothetical protein
MKPLEDNIYEAFGLHIRRPVGDAFRSTDIHYSILSEAINMRQMIERVTLFISYNSGEKF